MTKIIVFHSPKSQDGLFYATPREAAQITATFRVRPIYAINVREK